MRPLVLVLLLALGLPRTGLADTPDQLIDRGVDLRREGKDALALELFEEAYARSQSTRALAQVALAHQALGDWLRAEAQLTRALAEGGPWIERNRAPLEGALKTIRERLAWLEVRGQPDGATVEANGRVVGQLPLDGPVRVVAGDVVVRVSAEGYEPISRPVTIGSGRRAREVFRLVPIASEDAASAGEIPAEPQGVRRTPPPGSVDFGVPHAPTVQVELGYSAIPRVSYLIPVAPWFAIGGQVGLDAGLFHSLGEDVPGTLTFGAALPLRFAVIDSTRIRVQLAATPGIGLTIIDYTNVLGAEDFDLPFDVTGEYFAVLLRSSLDVGYRASRVFTIGGGVEVPAALFFGGGTELSRLGLDLVGQELPEPSEFNVVPVLFGPTIEARLSAGVTLGAKLRLGPHITSGDIPRDITGDDSTTELGLQAQLGVAFAL